MSLRFRLARVERNAAPVTAEKGEQESYKRYLAGLTPEERRALYEAKWQEREAALTPEERAAEEARYEHLRGMTPQELLREFQKLLKRGL